MFDSRSTPVVERPNLRGDILASIPAGTRAHLAALGAAVPVEILSDNAWLALLLIASAWENGRPRCVVDAYQHANGEWVVECHGMPWQEPRYSPAGWQIMYERSLAHAVIHGNMPLCDIWLDACRQIAAERPNGSMLPDGLQFAEAPAAGGDA